MQIDRLNLFYQDENMRELVKDYLFTQLDKLAIEKVYNREDVKGMADAKEAIEKAFNLLDETYGARKTTNTDNSAR